MPRILRNYLISFLIIGTLLGIIHALDLYFNPREATSPTPEPTATVPQN
jgi:disulfide bond formation protein DsbB